MKSGRKPWMTHDERIVIDGNGFELLIDDRCEFRALWESVRGIAAFKRDLFTIDEIYLAFRVDGESDFLTVSESASGYDELEAEIERRYSVRTENWWKSVAFPPFATCWTVIWGDALEPAECPSCDADITGITEDKCPRCGGSLAGMQCPECRGLGAHPDRFSLVAGLAGVLIGAIMFVAWYALVRDIYSTPSLLFALGCGFSLLGVLFLVFRGRPSGCTRCEGTEWWDPRGRTMRDAELTHQAKSPSVQ